MAYKPGSVMVLPMTAIHLDWMLPSNSCDLPMRSAWN